MTKTMKCIGCGRECDGHTTVARGPICVRCSVTQYASRLTVPVREALAGQLAGQRSGVIVMDYPSDDSWAGARLDIEPPFPGTARTVTEGELSPDAA